MTRPNPTKFRRSTRPIAEKTDAAQPLFTEREVATLLSVSIKTLRNWRVTGQGPPFRKLSRIVRYSANDVQTWVDLRRRISTSDCGGDVDA